MTNKHSNETRPEQEDEQMPYVLSLETQRYLREINEKFKAYDLGYGHQILNRVKSIPVQALAIGALVCTLVAGLYWQTNEMKPMEFLGEPAPTSTAIVCDAVLADVQTPVPAVESVECPVQ